MTKYYFVSYLYVHKDGCSHSYGHCIVTAVNKTLNELANMVQETLNLPMRPTILCLKDLSKEEYEMLSGIKL